MINVIEIELLNWEKHQARSDLKHPTWFKCYHDIFDHEDLWAFGREEIAFFWYLLCQASKQNSARIRVSVQKAMLVGRFERETIKSTIKKLEEIQTCKIICTDAVQDLAGSRTGSVQQNRIEENRIEKNRREVTSVRDPNGPRTDSKPISLGSEAFQSYSTAYSSHYGSPPVRNKKVNSQFKQLAERLGDEAVSVSEFYLQHKDFTYVRSGHCVDLLLRDAEKLRTEWATGRKVTSIKARQDELLDANTAVMKEYLATKNAKEREADEIG